MPRGHLAFDCYDFSIHLDTLAADQQAEFSGHAADARSELDACPALPLAALGAAVVLVVAAVRPRLVEYR